jgi:hypothetical protein
MFFGRGPSVPDGAPWEGSVTKGAKIITIEQA